MKRRGFITTMLGLAAAPLVAKVKQPVIRCGQSVGKTVPYLLGFRVKEEIGATVVNTKAIERINFSSIQVPKIRPCEDQFWKMYMKAQCMYWRFAEEMDNGYFKQFNRIVITPEYHEAMQIYAPEKLRQMPLDGKYPFQVIIESQEQRHSDIFSDWLEDRYPIVLQYTDDPEARQWSSVLFPIISIPGIDRKYHCLKRAHDILEEMGHLDQSFSDWPDMEQYIKEHE
jgi:hypothetical protein